MNRRAPPRVPENAALVAKLASCHIILSFNFATRRVREEIR